MIWLALALSYSGFAALCLAMEKHQLELYGKDRAGPRRMRALRAAGWLLLSVAFALCVVARGWAVGTVQWLGALTAGAAVLALWLLPYRPRAIVPAALAAPAVGMLLALLA
ncbi:MAG: DUF3325 domain-containing protein [Gammaproteobacteria bacterium]|uniref:Membrane protein n=2 Tax=Xanthomonas boreopolis TaxID=86183 RepID=A0A919KI74_9XANT|nr:DUF3325 domain-containing protein [Pseudomonas sp. Hp2]GHH54119.1 membrane protein [[Pseudomonas] boreopolis]